MIDELIVNIPQARVIILIFESKPAEPNNTPVTKALVYSMHNINSLDLVKK